MSANILTSKYMTAKQAMIEGYRGMHKAPAHTTWNEVQDLQDQMQSAAVELAEYMASIKDGSWRDTVNALEGAKPSLERQAIDEIMAEEGHTADMLNVMHQALAATESNAPETDLSRLVQVVKSGDFVILDTETTGLYENAEICQIAIIDSNGTPLVDTLVRPQKPIPADATRIHGITNDMVRPYPDWLNINEAVWNACKGKTVIVYNAEYDFRLIAQSEKACRPFALSDWHMVKRECAMLAYGEHRGIWNEYHGNWKWHKLSDAASRIGYTLPDEMKAHSALADCLMTLAICRKLAGV